jgi:hypothetical protein
MSKRSFPLVALIFTTVSVVLAGRGEATTAVRLSLEDLTAVSSAVVHGTVVDTQSRWNETRSLIVTDVRIRVADMVKGSPAGEITVTQLGGEVGKLKTEVPGAADFRAGEETVLFLAEDGRGGGLVVAGLSQGRFDVTQDARTGRKTLHGLDPERLEGLARTGPAAAGRGVPPGPALAAPDGSVSLERFLARVRDLVETAGQGGGR